MAKGSWAARARRRGVAAGLWVALSQAPLAASAQPNPAESPEELVVTPSLIAQPKRQIGTAVSTIDFEEIELRGYTDVADVLRTQPGIGVSNSGGLGKNTILRVRGEEGYRTLLVIDGIKAVDPSVPHAAPSFDSLLTTSDLQRIEVLRGPQGFLYGADAGGVVNVITKRGADDLGGQVGIEYGEYATRKIDAALAGGGERGDYYVSATDLDTDGFNSQTADTVIADDDGAANTTIHAKLGWNASDELRVQLVARDIDASTQFDDCFSTTGFAVTHDCSATTEQTVYKLSADYRHGGFAHAVGYSGIEIATQNFAERAPAFATDGESARLEYTGTYTASKSTTLVYGLDSEDQTLAALPSDFDRRQNGYYFEYEGAFDEKLFVSAGARYDDSDDFGEHTSVRAGAAYVQDLGNDRSLKYRASYGTGFRAPSLFELAYNSGPFALPPAAGVSLSEETSNGYDLGLEYFAANGGHYELTYFDQNVEDETFFDLVAFSGYLQSSGVSTSTGVEVGADVPLGERLRFIANWTNNEAKNSANEQRLRRPRNLANLGVEYRSAGDRLAVMASYRLSRDAIDIGGVALDDYEVLDISASYSFGKALELYGRIQNATDEAYQEVLGYNTAGRSIYGGVRLHF
jgi:vitamin B12 transporter